MGNSRGTEPGSWQGPVDPAGRGAIWRRVDLHLHSPGVKSFNRPFGANVETQSGRAGLAEEYVRHLAEQHISLGAITDYNGIRVDWYRLLAEKARAKGITLLPGTEISFKQPKHDLHILVVFDGDADLERVNRFLVGLDIEDRGVELHKSDGTHRDIRPDGRVEKVLLDLRESFNALIIIPHPDETNGLVKSYGSDKAVSFLSEVRPDAIEHCPEAVMAALKASRNMPQKLWSCLSFVEFSDPKGLEDIGAKRNRDEKPRATFIKLSAMNVDALRLALHDPETRLKVGEAPPPCAHPRIRSLAVESSGFLGNLQIVWNDDLNVIMGTRGAGKSAILETLRYALDLPVYSDQPYREDLVRHALGSGGKVTVALERPVGPSGPSRYLVSRVWGEEPRAVDAETGKSIPVAPCELLGPRGGPTLLGQREIYAVSQSEEYRLALLDELIGQEARDSAVAVQKAVEGLRANARAILDVRKHLDRREQYRQRLRTVQHEIEVLEKHGAAEKLREVINLRSDGQLLRSAAEAIRAERVKWGALEQSLFPSLETAHRSLLRGQSSQRAILQEAAAAVAELRTGLREVLEEGTNAFEKCNAALGQLSARWNSALVPLEAEINRIKQEAHTEALDPDRLLKLHGDRTALTPLIEELDRMDGRLRQLLEDRKRLLLSASELRQKEHKLRRERAEAIAKLLQDRLILQVEFKGHKADYRKRLTSLLRGAGLHSEALERLVTPEATDGIQLAAAVSAGSQEVQRRFDLTPAMADRLVKWVTDDESRLFELETLIPPDNLKVQLRVEDKYRSLESLSVGQRATAILLLLFALEGRVLVLDQPEDDLDNRFVYEDIVQILRDQKGLKDPKRRRQVIAATHNANIPVLGDAELVLALEDRRDRAHVIDRASIDDGTTRGLIKAIMEGGEEAFRRRAEKYGGVPGT